MLLVAVVVILSEILLISSNSSHSTDDIFAITMIATTALAIIIIACLFAFHTFFPGATIPREHFDIGDKIKLRFLWLFTIATVTYSISYLVYDVECFEGNHLFNTRVLSIVCDVLLVIFRLTQTLFLTTFSKRTFVNNLLSYYGLLTIFLANVSVIVVEFANQYHHVHDDTTNLTESGTFVCYTNSSAGIFLDKIDNYLNPAILEYSLLAVLFVFKVWPKKCQIMDSSLNVLNDSLLTDSVEERTALLGSSPGQISQSSTTRRSSLQSSWFFWTICLAVFIQLPDYILICVRIYKPNDSHAITLFHVYNSAVMTVLFFVVIRLFYQLQSECTPIFTVYKFVSRDYLILFSFVGSLMYYIIRLMAYIELATLDNNTLNIYGYVISILGLYLQTISIFQMNYYKKNNGASNLFSIEYTCLFLSVSNLFSWIVDSFLISNIVFAHDAPTKYYGVKIWILFYTLLFPVVVFYRFKCYVAYYELYDKLSK